MQCLNCVKRIAQAPITTRVIKREGEGEGKGACENAICFTNDRKRLFAAASSIVSCNHLETSMVLRRRIYGRYEAIYVSGGFIYITVFFLCLEDYSTVPRERE